MSNPNKTEFSLRCGISVYKWNLHLHSTLFFEIFKEYGKRDIESKKEL